MNTRHHIISTLTIGCTTVYALDAQVVHEPLLFLSYNFGLFYGSFLADVDHEDSPAHRFIPLPTRWIPKILNHRGFTHEIYGWLFFVLGSFCLFQTFNSFSPILNSDQIQTMPFCLWFGFAFGYTLHLVEDYFSAASLRFFGIFSPYDKWTYKKYGKKYATVKRWKKRNGKNIPCRHYWGRGYVVGETSESIFFYMIIISCLMLIIFKWYKIL